MQRVCFLHGELFDVHLFDVCLLNTIPCTLLKVVNLTVKKHIPYSLGIYFHILCGVGTGGAEMIWTFIQAKLLQSCLILCDPADSSPPGSLSMGLSRQEYWSGLPFSSLWTCNSQGKNKQATSDCNRCKKGNNRFSTESD